MKTSWGSDMTGSWEQEGSSALILQWFRPPSPLREKYKWDAIWPTIQVNPTDSSVSRWLAGLKKTEWFNKGGKYNWALFEPTEAKPVWVDPHIEQEVDADVWEIKSADEQWTFTMWDLYTRLRTLNDTLRATPRGTQVHVVFDRPPKGKGYNARLAALVDWVNMGVALGSYSSGSAMFLPYLGSTRISPEKTAKKLYDGGPIEQVDKQGHRTGELKFNFLGLREAYGKGKLGFEFRGGFGDKNSVDDFMKRIDHVVYILGHLGDVHGAKGNVNLLTHYDFANHYTPVAALPKELRPFLKRAAEECINKRLEAKQKIPWRSDKDPNVLLGRWGLAYIPWEKHPLGNSGGERKHYRNLRTTLTKDLMALREKARRTDKDTPSLANPMDVNERFAKFFRDAELQELIRDVPA